MRRPLAVFSLLFCLGIAASRVFSLPFIWIFAAAAACFFFCLVFYRRELSFNIGLTCLIFLIGTLWLKNYTTLPKAHIGRRVFYKTDNSCILKGFVRSEPFFKAGRTSFILEAQEARFGNWDYQCCGRVRVRLLGAASFTYGDVLVLEGKIYRPFLPYRDAAAAMSVQHPAYASILAHNGGSWFKKNLLRLKDNLQALFFQYNPPVTAAVLEAMILGEKRNIPPAFYRAMMQTGTVHILVVSGFNTSLVIFILVLLLKLARLRRLMRLIVSLPILLGYCLMTGATTPVVRATVMTAVFMLSYLFKRQPDIFNSCSLSALCVLSYDPAQLFDIGAQLSFVSVLAIAWFYPKIKAFLRLGALLNPAARFFSEGFLVSLSAWLGTAGIIAYYFKIFSPVTVLANIFIVPLAALITLCGVTFIFTAVILPPAAPFFALICQFLVALLVKTNALLLSLPAASFYLP